MCVSSLGLGVRVTAFLDLKDLPMAKSLMPVEMSYVLVTSVFKEYFTHLALTKCFMRISCKLYRNFPWLAPIWVFTIYVWASLKHKQPSARFVRIYLSSSRLVIHTCPKDHCCFSDTVLCSCFCSSCQRKRWATYSREMSVILPWLSFDSLLREKKKSEKVRDFPPKYIFSFSFLQTRPLVFVAFRIFRRYQSLQS